MKKIVVELQAGSDGLWVHIPKLANGKQYCLGIPTDSKLASEVWQNLYNTPFNGDHGHGYLCIVCGHEPCVCHCK